MGLERDLDIGRESPRAFGRVEHRRHRFGRHQRGGAAAEEDRSEPAFGLRCLMREIGEQSPTPQILIHRIADMAVEIAIRAFGDAERRSEEHTSELQSLMRISYAVFCLKKKKKKKNTN